MAQLEQLWLLNDCCGKGSLSLDLQAELAHFYWLLFSTSQTVVLLLQQTYCFYMSVLDCLCVRTSCVHELPANCVPLFACTSRVGVHFAVPCGRRLI